MTLNADRINALAGALESGEYRKGEGYLCQVGPDGTKRMCCLGVATELAITWGLEITSRLVRDGTGGIPDHYIYDGEEGFVLIPKVAELYGFSDSNPSLPREDGTFIKATTWNDCGQYLSSDVEEDFTTIAAAFRRLAATAAVRG